MNKKSFWFISTVLIVFIFARYRFPGSTHYSGITFSSLEKEPKRPVVVDISKSGFSPGVHHVFTHNIQNARWSKKAYNVRFELVNCDLEVQWQVHTKSWDPKTKSLTKPLKPGERFSGIHLIFHFPKDLKRKEIIYKGGLAVIDKDTNETLGFQPIIILSKREGL